MGFDKDDLLRQTGYEEGDIMPIYTYHLADFGESTTKTSFAELTNEIDHPRHNFDRPVAINGDGVKIGMTFQVNNDTNNEDVTVRGTLELSGNTFGETTYTDPGFDPVEIAPVSVSQSGFDKLGIEAKVTGGTGKITAPSFTVYQVL